MNKIFLNGIENKFKSKAILYHNLKAVVFGWSLYEVVEWKRYDRFRDVALMVFRKRIANECLPS